LKNVETHGTENAEAQTSKSTYTIKADAYLSVETAGATSQEKIWNGETIEYAENATEVMFVSFLEFPFLQEI
jgi:hypothetical protein